MIVSVLLVGGSVAVKTAAAATVTPATAITHTLKVGSTYKSEVALLQTDLGLTADGSFGPKTKAAVEAWQTSKGLTADGVFGPKSAAALAGGMTMTYPAGCTSGTGFSSTTGQPCTGTVTTTYPAGCTSAVGFSPTTGASCATGVVTTPQGTGPLSVSLATDNPAAGNLIQGQATADLAHYEFTGTGTLTQLTLHRTGISDNSVFPNVYLYNGNTRLTDSASVNSSGQIIFNGLNIAVNGSLDLSVKADIVGGTTTESTVQVTLTSYMVSGGAAATSVSLAGNLFYVNSGTGILSTVTVGTNTVAVQSISAGTQQLALWSAPINVSLHPVWLKSASFDVIGSAPSNALANVGLFANGVQVATSTGINSMGYLTFDLSAAPFSMTTGSTTLEVRADVVNGSSRNIQVSLQHASDLMVTDSQVGVNIAITNLSSTTFSINQGGLITIQQGSLVAQSDPTFNSQTNVTGGASNVTIASYKLTSYGEDVKVNTVYVTPTISGSPAACSALSSGNVGLENVTLYYNGSAIGSSQPGTVSSGCTFNQLTFTPGSNLTISGGTTGTFQVHADLINGSGTPQYSSGTIGATIVVQQYQGITSGQVNTSPLTLSGSNTQTIATGSLSIAQNANFLSQTVNPNSSAVQIGSFTLQNQSTSEGVDVNSLNVGLYTNSGLGTVLTSGSPVPITDISTLTLTGITGTVTPVGQPTGSNVFSTNFTIPAGGSVTVGVVANVGSTNGASFVTALQPVAVGHSSRVTITSANTAGQTITLGVGALSTPTLVASGATNAQFISTAGAGAPNAATETYNFVSTSGSANIVGLKFAALSGNSGTAGALPVSDFAAPTLPETALVVGSNAASFAACPVATPCTFLVTTNGVVGGTNAVVTGYYNDATHFNVTAITTPMVAGCTTTGTCTPGVPTTIYQLATTGVTGVALNSPGVATGSASFSGGIAYISSISGATLGTGTASYIAVPNSPSGITIPAFMSFGPVNSATSGGVASGTNGQILLEYVQYQTGSNTSYLAPAVPGTVLTLVGSKPNISLTSSGSALTNSATAFIGTLTVTADNSGDIALDKLPLSVSVSVGNGGTIGTGVGVVKLTDTNGVSLGSNFTANAVSSGEYAEVFGSALANHYRIAAGQSKTFEIHADLSGITTFGSSATVSVSLGAPGHFVWDDINGNDIANVSTTGTVTAVATPTLFGDGVSAPSSASDLAAGGIYSYPSGSSASIHN